MKIRAKHIFVTVTVLCAVAILWRGFGHLIDTIHLWEKGADLKIARDRAIEAEFPAAKQAVVQAYDSATITSLHAAGVFLAAIVGVIVAIVVAANRSAVDRNRDNSPIVALISVITTLIVWILL